MKEVRTFKEKFDLRGDDNSSFQERPKHLDPARSYSSNEYAFIAQIYEPLFQYHYLKKPYELIPLTASEMPKLYYYH